MTEQTERLHSHAIHAMTSTIEHFKKQLEDATLRHQSGQIQEAMTLYQTLLKQFPGHPHILYLCGLAHQDLGDLRGAMGCISKALTVDPDNGTFHYALGILLRDLGHGRAALERFRDAIQRDPHNAELFFRLGDTHMDLGETQEAQHHFREAIRLRPLFMEAWINLGLCLKALKQLDEALACFQQVVHHDPDNAEGHVNLGLTHLLMGNLVAGWQAYEWRFRLETEEAYLAMPTLALTGEVCLQQRPTPGARVVPRWEGSPLRGKTLLILSEQGFGDTLQFVRYLGPLKAAGARVLLTCPRPLMALLRTLPAVDRTLPPPRRGIRAFQEQVAKESVDWFFPLLSLPLLLKTRMDSIPASVPYLQPDPDLARGWADRLRTRETMPSDAPRHTTGRPVRIGVVWQGKPLHKNDPLRRRSCTLADLAPLATVLSSESPYDVTFFGLQKEEEVAKALPPPEGMTFVDLKAELHDFAHTAAILSVLDLLITIDTSVAHLGGALGKPVWVLLPFAPDWRWSLDQERTPWYPSVRLFRQTTPNSWKAPVEQMCTALPAFMDAIMDR